MSFETHTMRGNGRNKYKPNSPSVAPRLAGLMLFIKNLTDKCFDRLCLLSRIEIFSVRRKFVGHQSSFLY
ncbi:MAG: hypothetical protein H0X72_19230 [Acidobacteria bacterium]|nr:hypothetical protein [Acidobacteriota bacterium]